MNWLDSMAAEAVDSAFPDEAATVPGTVRWLTKIRITPPYTYHQSLRRAVARKGPTRGFLYNILDKGGKLLDVGSAATLPHLFSRLAAKRKIPGATHASISYVKGLPGARDLRARSVGGIDRKVLHCHELLRQYRNRSSLRNAGRYDPRSRLFDEDA